MGVDLNPGECDLLAESVRFRVNELRHMERLLKQADPEDGAGLLTVAAAFRRWSNSLKELERKLRRSAKATGLR